MQDAKQTAEERILNAGYEDVVIFGGGEYDAALIGVSEDGRAVYSYEAMVECLTRDGMTEEEAVEWIDYNTIRALPYAGDKGPVIVYAV